MHIHLDPIGGIAGDMFAAALLDLRPELEAGLHAALETAGFTAIVRVAREAFNDGVLSGSRFKVRPVAAEHHDGDDHSHGHNHDHSHDHGHDHGQSHDDAHAHDHGHNHDHDHSHDHSHQHQRHYKEVVALFTAAEMPIGVRARALDMFRVLGEAEAAVHGRALEDVAFHEVGAWDSIADIMAAAWLVEALGVESWSCAPIPIGGGRVQTAHGELAVPAPATTILLQGMPMQDDGRAGERVTPTGAAILKHLQPSFEPLPQAMTLAGAGSGFGTRKLRDMSNVLRALAFTPVCAPADAVRFAHNVETLAVCEFEIDDQSGEDLAVGLQHLRAMDAIIDVIQAPVFGKKGRMAVHVRILTRPATVDAVIAACLDQTSTLGVRHYAVQRTSLARDEGVASVLTTLESNQVEQAIRVKRVERPAGSVTRKAEMDDLAQAASTRAAREQLRRQVETPHALDDDDDNDNDDGVDQR
jgi:uncharacterized protein (TIGR00299 family) protein